MRIFAIFCFIILTSDYFCFSQNNIFKIPLKKSEDWYFTNIVPLTEVKDKSAFITPFEKDDCAIGFITMSGLHEFYNNRNKNDSCKRKYEQIISKYDIDTMSFANNNLLHNKIYACVAINNGYKYIIIDTDFDKSFNNENIYHVNFNKEKISGGADDAIYINLDLTVKYDSVGFQKEKKLPISILANYIDYAENFGNNDSLQIYINPAIYYSGEFVYDKDTVNIGIECQNFDQLYNKKRVNGFYNFYDGYQCYRYFFDIESVLKVGNARFIIKDIDFKNKILDLEFVGKDTIGIQKGYVFQSIPAIEFKKEYSLVFFTSSFCVPCKHVLKKLKSLYGKFSNVDIFSISSEEDTISFNKYIHENDIKWAAIYDNRKKNILFGKYEIEAIPVIFLINKEKIILDVVIGQNDCLELLNKIEKNLGN